MGKPVKTNIAPPPAPPVTVWDSTNIEGSAKFALEGTTEFQNYINSLAFSWMLDGNAIDAHSFDYIFMAANGMDTVDLTVTTAALQNGIIVTGNGMDTITGNNSNELFFSGNGKDTVNAGGGDDIVYAGNGVDTVHGDGGNDTILGENGDDLLFGDAGNDTIFGGLDNDTIRGGDGSDELQGEEGNDILFGDADNDELWGGSGNDTLDGGSDLGTASVTTTVGGSELRLKDGHPHLLETLLTGSVAVATPSALQIANLGIYAPVNDGGVPTEFVGTAPNTEPKLYFVYSITPSVSGSYTVAYTRGNNLDGTGNPGPDIQHVNLVAGNTYYFNLYYDASNDQQVQIEVYTGTLTQSQIEATGSGAARPIASLNATVPNYHAFFEEVTLDGGTIINFTAGDDVSGEEGADTFVYDDTITGNNVDVIHDYNQSEGDTLMLKGVYSIDDFTTHMKDVDGDGNDDLILLFGDNHAVALVGVTDINNVSITYDLLV